MTLDEAIKMAKADLKCMERDTSGQDEMCNSHKCDECSLNYERGNMGEQKEWLRMAIQALEQSMLSVSEKPNNCDLISRKALISHIENQSREWGEDYDAQQILGDIEDLPPVKSQICEDAISRQAVEDKLLKLCNELEGIFANIRMQNQDESVCGLCEYDCPAPYECPGFDKEDCFKLAYEKRYKWQSTEDLQSVKPQTGHWKRISMDKYTVHAQYWYRCDKCGKDNLGNTDWCPTCGANMSEIPTDSKDVIWHDKRNYSEIVVEPQESEEI